MGKNISADEEMAKAIVAQVVSLDDFISINDKLIKIALTAMQMERVECLKLARESDEQTGAELVEKIKSRGGTFPLV